MGESQLYLPFEPGFRLGAIDPVIKAKVWRARHFLAALHINPSQVAWILSNPDLAVRRVTVVGKSGKQRVCFVPQVGKLADYPKILRRLDAFFKKRRLYIYGSSVAASAFGKGDSIVRNAMSHMEMNSSWVIDLSNAFETVKTKHVVKFLSRPISWEVDCFNGHEVWVLAKLLTWNGRLRQGLLTSPQVFNMLMTRFDEELEKALPTQLRKFTPAEWSEFWAQQGIDTATAPIRQTLKLHRKREHPLCVYSRYGDDLCFSSVEPVFPAEHKVAIVRIVTKHGLRVNWRKTKEGKNGILLFPGVIVDHTRIRPTGGYIEKLAAEVTALEESSRQGHRSFLKQFGRRGRLRILQELLA